MSRIRNRYGLAVKVAAALGLAAAFAAGLAVAATTTVTLSGEGPKPATITVKWGDTVSFVNSDDIAHSITIPRTALAGPSIPPGGSWQLPMEGQAGNYLFRQIDGRPFLGAIVVQLAGNVTVRATPPVVVFGRKVEFTGTAPAGQKVKLEELVVDPSTLVSTWTERAEVTAGADGKWTASLSPKLRARFRGTASAGQLRSQGVLVGVQPSIVVTPPRGAKAGKQARVNARIMPAGAATAADLERYDKPRRRWVREERAFVTRAGNVTFRWKAVKGRVQLRVQINRAGLKAGFDPATSKPVAVNVR
jgi:plastocyanin